jgi:hypothetical protein
MRRDPLPSEVAVKPTHSYVPLWCVVFFALVSSVAAQEAVAPRHNGVPQDWSQGHIAFSRDTLALHPDLMYREPRVLHQAMQRWQPPNSDVFRGADPMPTAQDKSGPHSDWSVAPLGGRLVANAHPAKFSFDPGAPPDCTNDYVVFGLSTASTGTQANLVAFNHLYSGTSPALCGAAPTVLFAYDTTTVTGGKITTSPILSVDGTKIGFVESIPANAGLGITPTAIFHVLTWTAGQGKIGAAVKPTMTQMISVPLFSAKNDTASSPWIDYSSDIVYVGANDGKVYKITGVFKGTPALAGGNWPVLLGTNLILTPPVLDSVLGFLMVGSSNGNLYRISTATGAVATLPVGAGPSSGIVAAPIVDITNGTTFVVSANDGTSAVLVEADTRTMTTPPLSKARIGKGAASGTALNLYQPALSNNYYTNPSTGVIRLCGTDAVGTTPYQYAFGFTGRIMKTLPSFSQQLLTSSTARCTGWTEFFNPNVGGVLGTDFFFFGLTEDCTAVGGPGGCVAEITDANPGTMVTRTVSSGPSGIVVDNYSSAAQASSLYLTAEGINTAYKFTQNGLN